MSKKLLVSEAERREIARTMSKEFGTKIKYRVIDLDEAVKKLRAERARSAVAPYIELRPISPDLHKVPSRTAAFQKDPLTGVLYGIPISQDDYGNMKWQKIQVSDNLVLNLDNDNDAKIWIVLRFWPEIEGSPFQIDNPYFMIYDPVRVANEKISQTMQMKKAFERIEKIKEKPAEMVLFARYLGEEVRDNSNSTIVYSSLLMFANDHPFEFNNKWESKTRAYGERFATGKALGIISHDIDLGYTFRNIPIGQTDEEAILFLTKDNNIMNAISAMINEKDVLVKSILEEEKENKSKKLPGKVLDEIDDEILTGAEITGTGDGFTNDGANTIDFD